MTPYMLRQHVETRKPLGPANVAPDGMRMPRVCNAYCHSPSVQRLVVPRSCQVRGPCGECFTLHLQEEQIDTNSNETCAVARMATFCA